MKNIVFLIIPFIFCFVANAGDLPESVISLPDADVFIGEITEIVGESITVTVSYALFENYEVDSVTFPKFEYMTGNDTHRTPKKGDCLAVAAEFRNGAWHILFSDADGRGGLAAKSDGLNPKTLKLYSGGLGFTERMNDYINNGEYSYENRMRLKQQNASSEASGTKEGITGERNELSSKIAMETEIVAPPPHINAKTNEKGYDNPIRYFILTLISVFAGFVFSKRTQNRKRAR